MLFGRGKIEEIGDIVIPRQKREEHKKIDLEKEILRKLEKLSLSLLFGSGDKEIRNRALSLYGRIKLVKAVRGTEMENFIRLFVGMDVSKEFIEKLKSENLVEKIYRLSEADIKAKKKDEITKKLEELLKEEFELKDEVKDMLNGKPIIVNDKKIEIVEKMKKLGAFEIYLLPKGWFEIPYVDNINVERVMREFKELTKSLPRHIAKFLEI